MSSQSLVLTLCFCLFAACAKDPAPPQQTDEPVKTAHWSDAMGLAHAHPVDDRWVAGGQPTEEVLEKAKALGVRTIVSLRAEGEKVPFDEEKVVKALGMTFVRLPIASEKDLTPENVAAWTELFPTTEGKMLVHCGTSNRVGALHALAVAKESGADLEAALAAGRSAGLKKLEPAVRALIEAAPR